MDWYGWVENTLLYIANQNAETLKAMTTLEQKIADLTASNQALTAAVQQAVTFMQNEGATPDVLAALDAVKTSTDAATKALTDALNPPATPPAQ